MSTLDVVDQSIVLTLNHLQGMRGKKYSVPSQIKILELLKVRYSIPVCLRTLNYHLAKLEREKYIYRKRRNPINICGERTYQSTMYSLGKRAFSYLASLFGSFKKGYYSFKKYLQSSYISSRKELKETQHYLSRDENVRRLRELMKNL